MERIDLRNMTRPELKKWVEERGLEPYRGDQIFQWIQSPGIETFDRMTNLAKKWRAKLEEEAFLSRLTAREIETSRDGTRKFLWDLEDGERIESVLIPERGHYTLCISSQVGCAQQCRFCHTGRIGLRRNLSAAEIVNQVRTVKGHLAGDPIQLTNVVLMGMGEPLANCRNTLRALEILLDPLGLQLSHRHVTLSTAGLIPEMKILGEQSPVSLAVSLNAADDATRSLLMPVNRRYPLRDLIAACRSYPLPRGKRITFEYILLEGINDSPPVGQRPGGPAAGGQGQDQPDPLQSPRRLRISAAHGAAAPGLPGSPDPPPLHSHHPPQQRERYLRRLRAVACPVDRRRTLSALIGCKGVTDAFLYFSDIFGIYE